MSTNHVLDSLGLLRRELGLLKAGLMKDSSVGPQQMVVLYKLTESPATMSDLSLFANSDKAAMTRMVASLEEAGFVKKMTSPDDKRITLVELTAKGRAKASKAVALREKIGKRVDATLTASERKTLSALLGKVATGLKEARSRGEEL